jgi:hypothetical protein
MYEKNMITGSAGSATKNYSAGEGQQQFSRLTNQ